MTIKKSQELDHMVALAISRIGAVEERINTLELFVKELKEINSSLSYIVAAIQATQEDVVKRLGSLEPVVNELKNVNSHLSDIVAAMRVLLAIGRGVKWLAGMVASVAAIWYSIKQWIV